MSKHTLILVLSFIGALAMAIQPCSGKPQFINQVFPSGAPSPSQTVTFSVTLDQPASGNQVVNLGTDTPLKYSSFPSTVTVPSGYYSANFQVTLSSSASGTLHVEAYCNGGGTDAELAVAEDGK